MAERQYYEHVEKFLKKSHGCFHTEQTRGLGIDGVNGNIDVVGIRHVGGDLTGDIEVISCEVKDHEPFLKSLGQAHGYSVMAHRCYLAAPERFNQHQKDAAEYLGVGLISISGDDRTRCKLVQSAPRRTPMPLMTLELVERMGFGRCCFCGSFFRISDRRDIIIRSEFVVRSSEKRCMADAGKQERGYVFWVAHLHGMRRDRRTLDKRASRESIYDRRYLCSTCIGELGYAQVADET